MIKMEENKLLEQELFLLFDGIRKEWRRVLYFNDRGHGVEVVLTPMNPKSRDAWREVERVIVRCHRAMGAYGAGAQRQGDRLWRYVVRNRHSIIYREVQKAMLGKLPFMCVNQLLHWDFLSQIDWNAYTANSQNGGCAFALCKTRSQR